MADSIQLAQDVTKVVDVKVTDTSAPLRSLLLKVVNSIRVLEERVEELENAD